MSKKLRNTLIQQSRWLSACALLVATGGCTAPAQQQGNEGADQGWHHGGMVAAANPYAAEAAAAVLRQGGHAVDAAIAAHAVLGLVEPQSSGLGGGAFMLVYDRQTDTLKAYDARETAPAAASSEMFLRDGVELKFLEAWQSGISVGTPGTVALYELAHQHHGKLPLGDDLAAAIQLADEGFVVSPRLAGFLERMTRFSRLDDNPDTAAYFYPRGKALSAGDLRPNPDYAETLRRFVSGGKSTFYEGALAESMVAAARAEPNPGTLSMDDLAGYQVAVRDPVCGITAEERICTMPPPSSGLAQIMIVDLYDRLSSADEGLDLVALVDAQRLAYADRDHYVADSQFSEVPVAALIDSNYLAVRATQAPEPGDMPVPGDPGAVVDGRAVIDRWGRDTTKESAGTTHLSIIDTQGNVVSMTATVEGVFGSSRWAGGFLLNNQMTDFARTPTIEGKVVANQVVPGKRPRSSMSPVIVFDTDGEVRLVAGSPGGNSIVAYVAKTLVGVLRAGLSAQEAVDAPNIVARGGTVRVETGVSGGPEQARLLSSLGYPVQEREGENSGLHVIHITEQGLAGAADPRREGIVVAVPGR